MLSRILPRLVAPKHEPSTLELDVGGTAVTVALRRSARTRRFTLRVRQATGELTLGLPERASVAAARSFVERHRGWIATRLARVPAQIPFVPGEAIPLRGAPHVLAHRPGRGASRVEPGLRGAPPAIAVAGAAEHFGRRVTDFLKQEARRDLREAVARHGSKLGVAVAGVKVKDTTSRWGSCSARGGLSFSWRLVLAPPFVLDYLAAHEVAHRKEMNHGPRFWELTRRLCPETDRAEAWLKANGPGLHRYGARPVSRRTAVSGT